jgi:5'-nucleotidase
VSWPKDQVRIVFDADGVLFSKTGVPSCQQFDQERGHIPLSKGPMQTFALKLQKVRRALGSENGWRVRTFLVIARKDENTQRVFSTLRDWGLDIDEIHILGGLDKAPFLRAIDPAIFFHNSNEHIERVEQHIPAAHVPCDARNNRVTIDAVVLATP